MLFVEELHQPADEVGPWSVRIATTACKPGGTAIVCRGKASGKLVA